jgi:excisionase family DNA binding protein
MDVSESTIRRLILAGKLPARRIGKQWRILLSDLRQGSQD